MVYKATLYLEVDGITIKKSMIPSHAIFIALLFDRPIYVTEEVLRISKELDDEEGFFEEEL
jgi:bifunctional DNase/RNase